MTAGTSRPRWLVWLIPATLALAILTFATSVLVVLIHQRSTRPEIVIDDPLQAATVVIAITGAVVSPGTYELPGDSRVQHALDAAGGLRPDADLAAVNPAVRIVDGQQIIVPAMPPHNTEESGAVAAATEAPQPTGNPSTETPVAGGPDPIATLTDPDSAAAGGTQGGLASIDINSADVDELDQLPGIGPVKAAAIVAYREEHGPFQRIDDLAAVDGISADMVTELSPYIRADP